MNYSFNFMAPITSLSGQHTSAYGEIFFLGLSELLDSRRRITVWKQRKPVLLSCSWWHLACIDYACVKFLFYFSNWGPTVTSAVPWVTYLLRYIKLHYIVKSNQYRILWNFKTAANGFKLLHTHRTRPSSHMLVCTYSQTHMLAPLPNSTSFNFHP